ncbi:unnamed protein product [Ranitomeya imitator]|uniref:Large ribosomal subunit protein eL14 n=1 Tax=Ranitomeya imitator TaxID=111125 RepID=A0ABN9KZA5_9NEOB|nr:unnamed protein product [Ranitomeya imitator]
MDRVLRPHRQYASAYLDDIVIYSMDWETHLQKVQAVIDDLRDAGLTANPKKCHIGLEEARYLGYVIGRGVVKPQIDKIQAIQGWPQPVNKKQVQAFLGIAGYYRRFIPNFAAMATPLTDLTKGKGSVMVKWTSAAEEAFHSLKRALCSQPVLVTPDFSSEFVVQTDASDTGVGAVLSQVRDGVEHPVLYLSRKLNVHEQRYAVVEKECLAIKWALDSLKYYLAGRKFRLVTDHAPLKWMHLHKDRNSRVTRWFLALQAYSFTVEHRPGVQMGNADAYPECTVSKVFLLDRSGLSKGGGGICKTHAGVVDGGRFNAQTTCPLTPAKAIPECFVTRYNVKRCKQGGLRHSDAFKFVKEIICVTNVFKRYVQIGRVAYISFGPHAGKLVAIVDVIDQNRALVDGPCSGVRRQAMPFKCMHLTNFVLKFPHSARQKCVRVAWEKEKVNEKWAETNWAKRIDARQRKAKMTDFDRYKVMKAKKMRNKIIRHEMKKLVKETTKKSKA